MSRKNIPFWRKILAIGVIGIIILLMILSLMFGAWVSRLPHQIKPLEEEPTSLLVQTWNPDSTIERDPLDLPTGASSLPEGSASSESPAEGQDAEPVPEDSSQSPEDSQGSEDIPGYQLCYPALMAHPVEKNDDNTQKIVYLTFDDGPSENTEEILDILAQYNAHAAFFVSAQFGSKEDRARQYNQILDSGNTIGLHTYTHNYQKIYASVDAFLADLDAIYQEVYEATDFQADMIRFPGGSINNHNTNCFQALIDEITRRGFTYHDWVVSAADAEKDYVPTASIVKAVVEGCEKRNKSVVLLHDINGKYTTVEALPTILETLQNEGYEFRALDDTVSPFHFVAHSS